MFISQGEWLLSVGLVLLAAFFDLLDGAVARALGVTSPIGKDLDSLADVVSFGVVPAFWAVSYSVGFEQQEALSPGLHWLGLLIAPSSALRLAKFNHDTRQTLGFIGLPTPANAMLWAGVILGCNWDTSTSLAELLLGLNKFIGPALALATTYLLHAELSMLSLKWKPGGLASNQWMFVLLGGCLVIIMMLGASAILGCMLWYLFLSITYALVSSRANVKNA